MRGIPYTPETIRFIKRNLLKMGYEECANRLGLTHTALRMWVSTNRKKYKLPTYTKPVGTIETRIVRGSIVQFEKTETGWKYIKKTSHKPRPKKEIMPKINAVQKQRVVFTPEPDPMKIKPFNGIVLVRVDSKT